MSNTKNVLVIPGGGIKGYATAHMLIHFEKQLQGNLIDYFDLVGGTSTGSIISSALSHNIPLWNIAKLYEERGQDIFGKPRNIIQRMYRAKYNTDNLINVLEEEFNGDEDNVLFGDLKTKTMVFSADTEPASTLVYKSWKDKHKGLPLHRVVASSCAAPTYFSAINGVVDGGVWAADPSLEMYAEAKRLWPNSKINMFTFGTGYYPFNMSLKTQGYVYWGQNIIEYFMQLQTQRSQYVMNRLLRRNYYAFDPLISREYKAMDDASDDNLIALREAAVKFVKENEEDLVYAANALQK